MNHALTAAMRTLMKEYLILVTQLEHLQRQGLLSLQKLWFYIQPTMRTMEILASIGKSLMSRCCSSSERAAELVTVQSADYPQSQVELTLAAEPGEISLNPETQPGFLQRPLWTKESVWVGPR